MIRRSDTKDSSIDLAFSEHGVPGTSLRRGDLLREGEKETYEEVARPEFTSLFVHLADCARHAGFWLRSLRVLAGSSGAFERLPSFHGGRRRTLQLYAVHGVPEIYDHRTCASSILGHLDGEREGRCIAEESKWIGNLLFIRSRRNVGGKLLERQFLPTKIATPDGILGKIYEKKERQRNI